MARLDDFLKKAIPAHQQKMSAHLGDRTRYAGASDIAGCPRKAVLGKLQPVAHSIKQQLVFARGHAAQAMFREFFLSGGAAFQEEVEICHPSYDIVCHIDFLFRGKNRFHVVEMKSTGGIPEEPYGSWVDQLHVQMGLLRIREGEKAEIGGSILAVDLNKGEYREFNSYAPHPEVFTPLIERGSHILSAMRGECEPNTIPSILCGHCSYRTGCPAHRDQEIPQEVTDRVADYESLDRQKKALEKRMDPLKKELISFFGERFQGITETGIAVATTTVAPGETIDSTRLKKDFPDVFQACSKPKAGYTKLEVRQLPPAPLAKAA
ncbi:PD-(D/E)XK nuclease family protein [Geotalea uraniireducens]|nr:PD-(D/E)XK nuclease family protein [Geotalea uraniireducens]